MNTRRKLSNRGRSYVLGVIVAGMFAVVASFLEMLAMPVSYEWFILAALTVISGSATVKLPSIPASLSVSETFVFTSVLLFGPPAGTLTVALDGLIISFWLNKQRKEVHRVLFNMAAPALSVWVASQIFFSISGIQPLSVHPSSVQDFLLPLLIFTLLYFGLNSWLITFAVALETGGQPLEIWRDNFLWLALNFFCGASVAALLTGRKVDLTYLGAILPLLFVLYMTYRTSMARVEDANKHLQQVNTLYLSTIETLAMAIDAKDQVTHGHIRRVQAYATGLAQALGVREAATLHAVEAASLLHDMGKLAIPEHILNKPGRLTPSEFEKMKLHAGIGADILSAIQFPYPVVPIVRHHHENWNGTGYPDGISGTDIPIGARILSVVDCFDALTSDRPYRPALSDEDAVQILLERRGSMYDPLVVDTFVRVYKSIGPDSTKSEPPHQVISAIAKGIAAAQTSAPAPVAVGTSDHSERLLIFASLLTNVPGQVGSSDLAELSWYHLRHMIPASVLGLYRYEKASDELDAIALVGPLGVIPYQRRTALGQGLSGWVASTRQSILNSDPRLDLGQTATNACGELKSAASLPLVLDDQLIGVLTLYSDQTNAYSEQHLKVLSLLAPRLAYAVSRAESHDTEHATLLWDKETGLPNSRYLRDYVASEIGRHSGVSGSILLLRIGGDAAALSEVATLRLVASGVRGALRLGDLIFRLSQDELVCILNGADAPTTQLIAGRLGETLDRCFAASGATLDLGLAVGSATPPTDGTGVEDLVAIARRRLTPLSSRLISHTSTI
jgi:putative nucleotidyltransferase with HDIG domain